MTQPDSDVAICRACRDGDHDNCVIANYRYVQPGPGCACPCPIEQPDSDAREVLDPVCPVCLRPKCQMGYKRTPPQVSVSLHLAQRILAALEKRGQWPNLATELRERLPSHLRSRND